MNEGSGQVIHDYSGHGNNGTLGNSPGVDDQDPAWIRGVFAGSALSFGGNDYVWIPDSSSLEPSKVTVAAWVRGSTSPGKSEYVVAKGATGCTAAPTASTPATAAAWPSTSAMARRTTRLAPGARLGVGRQVAST